MPTTRNFLLWGCLFFLFLHPALGQNLVVNPSFESISACPLGPSEIHLGTGWLNPDSATPDLYNTCSWAFGGVDVPNNLLGFQYPRTGNGYAGIIMGEWIVLFGCTSFGGSGWREYLQAPLSAPLTAGENYCVTLYVSAADDVKFATDDFGIHFSNTQIGPYYPPFYPSVYTNYLGPGSPFNLTPQLNYTGASLTDSVNWVQLQWVYTATGGEQFMTMGNFKNDGNTTRTAMDCGNFHPYAYWYVDDVSVVPGTCTLPADFAQFEGTRQDNGQVLLQWNTTMERDVSHFLLYASADGEAFDEITKVGADGADNGSFYSWTDRGADASATYYRIATQDANGSVRYGEVVYVPASELEVGDLWQGAPGTVHFPAGEFTELYIFDMSGRVVKQVPLTQEAAQANLADFGIPPGMYIVRSGSAHTRITVLQ